MITAGVWQVETVELLLMMSRPGFGGVQQSDVLGVVLLQTRQDRCWSDAPNLWGCYGPRWAREDARNDTCGSGRAVLEAFPARAAAPGETLAGEDKRLSVMG